MTLTVATAPVVRALLDEASAKRYSGGVLGLRAQPVWEGATQFDHGAVPVRIVPCASALAVREALLDRDGDRWLVILTDRDDQDLGAGVTAHFVGQRLREPDLWAAVREQFQATGIDHRLVRGDNPRALALGLLTAVPPSGWPPAPGGMLTPEHVYGAVAAARLELGGSSGAVDANSVLHWATRGEAPARLADLRSLAGDALTDGVIEWLSDRCGAVGRAVEKLVHAGRLGDVVPLGLVARAVQQSPANSGPRALLRQVVGLRVSDDVLAAWAAAAEQCAAALFGDDGNAAAAVLARAETLLGQLEAEAYADASDVLRRSLTERLARLGEALRAATEHADVRASTHGPETSLADRERLTAVEEAWRAVRTHQLARRADDVRVPRAEAALRLTRWLATSSPVREHAGLAAYVDRHRDNDAWVDRAVNDAWAGVDEPGLARGLRTVLAAVRLRRDAHDIAFAQSLAGYEGGGDSPIPLEDLLAHTVFPLAKQQPVLLVVADGMSVAAATGIVDDLVTPAKGWLDCVPEGKRVRQSALALLPTLTTVSRASLLSGEPTVGEQAAEKDGFERSRKAHGMSGRLFHKHPLESKEAGFALAGDVAAAVDDTEALSLVACVLNTIDDALDRSDPGGTEWTAATVKHLGPLLERARAAGRVVVLTSDHGHVIERRDGHTLSVGATSSNRSRPADGGPPAGDGEIRVRGQRVLLHNGDAILAVDERLRYGPLKSGYHGGGSPAEVVVPVCVLAPGEAPPSWRLAPPQAPPWWHGAVSSAEPPRVEQPRGRGKAADTGPTLFDEDAELRHPDLASAVLRSPQYEAQRKRAPRTPVSDEQIGALLRALLSAPACRLASESAAAALGVAMVQLAGALPAVQRLLNVEQYSVISRDPDGDTIVLDETLLCEQFGV